MSELKEVRIKNLTEKTVEELKYVSRYYGQNISSFVKYLIKDYLEKCPKHIKEIPAIDRE